METTNERPVCHRAEDLVTYLYGEASGAEAQDFAAHMERCDACRTEFSLFNSVHESIVTWRNEALGTATASAAAPVVQTVSDPTPFVQRERRLSAWASLREFFSVSPVWLRGATAFAGLLLCALLVFAVTRLSQQPTESVKTVTAPFDQQKFDSEVKKRVDERIAEFMQKPQVETATVTPDGPKTVQVNRVKSKKRNGLNQEEREQLAADLGLIPGRDEELPFVLPEEPNQ